jgi:hypothetical protein
MIDDILKKYIEKTYKDIPDYMSILDIEEYVFHNSNNYNYNLHLHLYNKESNTYWIKCLYFDKKEYNNWLRNKKLKNILNDSF